MRTQKDPYKLPFVGVRLVKEAEPLFGRAPILKPEDAIPLIRDFISDYDREILCAVYLKVRLQPICAHIVSVGTIDASLFCVREIIKTALLSNAKGIILFHNHPSGDICPSLEDYASTEKIKKACEVMDLQLLDHIIVAPNCEQYYSFKDNKEINGGKK